MIIDTLENSKKYIAVHSRFEMAFNYLKNTDFSILKTGRHEIKGDEIFAIINEYETKDAQGVFLEAHKKYIDIQYVYSGSEKVGVMCLCDQVPVKKYDTVDDYHLFDEDFDSILLNKGMFGVFYPNDLHMPGLVNEVSNKVKKIVVKVKL